MGQAKARRAATPPTVYHHTSTLRTNLLWMSGVVEVEGKSKGAIHPKLGEIKTDALVRRAMTDFPPVAWFTTRIDVPRCLRNANLGFVDKETGEMRGLVEAGDQKVGLSDAMALNRVALGFRISDIPVVPWPEYRGYDTPEGADLNRMAREVGDDFADWYVSEAPVDLMLVAEFWHARSIMEPKLQRYDPYIADIRRMVTLCRETPGVFIPPSWLKQDQAIAVAQRLGIPVKG